MTERRIRICYVLNNFGIGGAETVALDLARGHDPERFDVEVLAALEPKLPEEPEMRRRFREAGVTTAAIHQDSFRSPLALWRLYYHLRRGRFDIVHGHNRGSDYWAVRLGALAGVPHRFWTRHLVYRDMTARQIRKYSSVSRRAERILAVSDTVREFCLDTEGIAPDQVLTVVNGIDLDKFAPLPEDRRQAVRAGLGHPENEKLLLFVGRFSEQKAPESFIELIWRLRAAGQPVRGYMCGHGPLEGALADQVGSGPGGVEVLGLRSDIPELLAACDLFVSTSRNEGLPLNVMEAMSCSAPFVAPGIPQIRELTANDPVLQAQLTEPPPLSGAVPEAILDGWARTVGQTIADPARLAAVGAAGRERIRAEFSLQTMVRRYEQLFLEAIERAR